MLDWLSSIVISGEADGLGEVLCAGMAQLLNDSVANHYWFSVMYQHLTGK